MPDTALPDHPLPDHPLPDHPLPDHPLPDHPLPDHPLPDHLLIDRLLQLLQGPAEDATELQADLLRRAACTERRMALRTLLLARAQEADEYLGASAGAARYLLALLDAQPTPAPDAARR